MFHAPEVKAVSVLVHVERFMVILLCLGITCYHVHSEELHVQRVAPIQVSWPLILGCRRTMNHCTRSIDVLCTNALS